QHDGDEDDADPDHDADCRDAARDQRGREEVAAEGDQQDEAKVDDEHQRRQRPGEPASRLAELFEARIPADPFESRVAHRVSSRYCGGDVTRPESPSWQPTQNYTDSSGNRQMPFATWPESFRCADWAAANRAQPRQGANDPACR